MAIITIGKLNDLYRLVGFVLVDNITPEEAIAQLKEYFDKAFPNTLPGFKSELKNHQDKQNGLQ